MAGNPRKRHAATHPLWRVKELVGNGQYLITQKVRNAAKMQFGMQEVDLRALLLNLNAAHFRGTNEHHHLPGLMVDHYVVPYQDQWIYLHLHINAEGQLVILNSFKTQS